jgi:hypothetical protein
MQIAHRLGIGKTRLLERWASLRKRGLIPDKRRNEINLSDEEIIDAWGSGDSSFSLQEKTGVSASTFLYRWQKMRAEGKIPNENRKVVRRKPVFNKVPQPSIADEIMIDAYHGNLSAPEVAEQQGIHTRTVYNYWQRLKNIGVLPNEKRIRRHANVASPYCRTKNFLVSYTLWFAKDDFEELKEAARKDNIQIAEAIQTAVEWWKENRVTV